MNISVVMLVNKEQILVIPSQQGLSSCSVFVQRLVQ